MRVSLVSFVVLMMLGSFTVGMWAFNKGWMPSEYLMMARGMYRSFMDTGMFVPTDAYHRRTRDHVAYEEPHVVKRPDAIEDGYLLINYIVLPDHRYEAILIDHDGNMLHRWPIDYSRVHEDGPASKFVHVVKPMPDGSVLANFDDDARALVRFDACGDPMWARTDQVYHHSIRADDRGGYWTWQAKQFDGGHDHRMVRFDENTGEILESIDLVEDVMRHDPMNQVILTLPEGFEILEDFPRHSGMEDLLHPNDVKPLPEAYADAFPQFEPGDLLISLRNINLVAVISRKTKNFVWASGGPWFGQHDPDWHADGTITVYSNNHHRFRTSIIEVDPKTRMVRDYF